MLHPGTALGGVDGFEAPAYEALRIQMMPGCVLGNISFQKHHISDKLLMSLAGNSFTASTYLAVLIAALVYAPIFEKKSEAQLQAAADRTADAVRAIIGL